MSNNKIGAQSDGLSAKVGEDGYQAQFERTLGKFESFAVAFSFISITTGLFATYGSMLISSVLSLK